MFYLALNIFQHIGSFNASHSDILNWLEKTDTAWEEAKFKSGGRRKKAFTIWRSRGGFKVWHWRDLKTHTIETSPQLPQDIFFASSQQNLKCLMIMMSVLRSSQTSPEAGLKLYVHIPNEQGLEVRTGEGRHLCYYWKIKYSKHNAKIMSPRKMASVKLQVIRINKLASRRIPHSLKRPLSRSITPETI